MENWKKHRDLVWTACGYSGAILVGIIGLALFGPEAIEDAEMIMPLAVLKLFHPFLAAICVTGAIATMLSTADPMLIMTSSEFTENILKPVILKGKHMDSKKELFISRSVTVVVVFPRWYWHLSFLQTWFIRSSRLYGQAWGIFLP